MRLLPLAKTDVSGPDVPVRSEELPENKIEITLPKLNYLDFKDFDAEDDWLAW